MYFDRNEVVSDESVWVCVGSVNGVVRGECGELCVLVW